ncbi:MAG: sulfite:cytochrome C oxidoreductase subunit B [Helicobacteraceae bacterium]|nr:sulfite:cytochrome C oxidoreductase subunit B [Candidatus Sulfurimonas ponti]MBL6973329.1 sulfite:cytochrome C oxidoreductase subunit B [Sulfurimonas sp.]
MKKVILIALLSAGALFAQVKKGENIEVPYISYDIKMGEGFAQVQANCLTCHSFGYMINQGPQSREHWYKKTMKMITHFKAPISKEDVEIITNYFAEHYGNGK